MMEFLGNISKKDKIANKCALELAKKYGAKEVIMKINPIGEESYYIRVILDDNAEEIMK